MITTRLLTTLDDLTTASSVVAAVWNDPGLAPAALLRAYSHSGNPVIGAYDGDAMVGAAIGFLAAEPELHLHSHIACALPAYQHRGVGFDLKHAQRAWCAEHGIASITWTFDPMLARNAYFNLHKLGAVARKVLPNFYGTMDDEFNRGERTDRMEAWWAVGDAPAPGEIVRRVAVPSDYLALRASDPSAAATERVRVVDELSAAFADGLIATDFSRESGYGFSR